MWLYQDTKAREDGRYLSCRPSSGCNSPAHQVSQTYTETHMCTRKHTHKHSDGTGDEPEREEFIALVALEVASRCEQRQRILRKSCTNTLKSISRSHLNTSWRVQVNGVERAHEAPAQAETIADREVEIARVNNVILERS